MKKDNITGIILAGGKSQRMGVEKGLVIFDGKPLIGRAVTLFNECCDEILISSNSDSYNYLGYKVIPDIQPDTGPMGGILSCLAISRNRINLVLSCDMPFITSEIFDRLSGQIGNNQVCVPWYENEHYEPLCGIYLKDTLEDMQSFVASGNFKLPDFFSRTDFAPLKIKDIDPPLSSHYFMNINNPYDLKLASQIIANQ